MLTAIRWSQISGPNCHNRIFRSYHRFWFLGVVTAAGVLWHFFVQILRLAVAALTLTARQPDYQVTDPSAIKDIHVRIEDVAGCSLASLSLMSGCARRPAV